ncbi:MAG: hypothetical protein O2944_00375 [Proteobacteria bacterium]|nr:hypothetical protein [Pseudomonadota bacterium]
MSPKSGTDSGKRSGGKSEAERRKQRQASALRENLKRRKDQSVRRGGQEKVGPAEPGHN